MTQKSYCAKRFFYLLYYIKQLDWKKFSKVFKYAKKENCCSPLGLCADIFYCIFKYNVGIMDYFVFRFFDKSPAERDEYAGTGFMYEYHLKMNPPKTRHILANKIDFYKAYAPFVIHANCTLDDLKRNNGKARLVLENPKGKIVVKDSLGQCGRNVEVLQRSDFGREALIQYMKKNRFNLAEEFIEQHAELARLSTSGLNTVRVITQLNKKGEVEILGARLRISVNCRVDNLASGNIAAPVDIETGKVYGDGVYSDITKKDVSVHPVTGATIPGFQVPMWAQVLALAKKAALHRPENRSIGWDIAITAAGPELIEGNHNWCKILWQLPVKTGLKRTLIQYL